MITEEQYKEAKKIVEGYDEQLRIANVVRSKRLKEEQLKREEECGKSKFGHEYRSSGGKWSPQGQMTCIDCGKTID